MILSILFVIAGFALLVYGGNILIEGASNVARYFGISELMVGLTVVSFGTSAPELAISIMSALEGHAEITLGNVVGSNNFNLFVVLGSAGVVTALKVERVILKRDIPLSLLFGVLVLLMGNDFFVGNAHEISRIEAISLLVVLGGYFILLFRDAKNNKDKDFISAPDMSMTRATLYIVGGLVGLVGGGKLALTGAVDIAHYIGLSEKVIGLTIVAVGTSLPELVTSIIASRKGNIDMALGNVIGSNIFNILLILGISCTIMPIKYDTSFNFDLFMLLGGTLVLQLIALPKPNLIRRWQSGVFLAIYIAYTIYLIKN